VNLIERKLKRRAKRAVARISERRTSMGMVMGQNAKPQRSLDGVNMRCKVVDFGSACWGDQQFMEEIQTRQYRAPEVILRSGYSAPADMWSFGCTAFELATGDMMFEPKGGQGFSDDEDHLAMMQELLGKMPKKIANGGVRSKDFFDRYGDLKRIKRLKYWSLDRMLVEKYKFPVTEARQFADFLLPILDFAPEKRPTAQQCLQHSWLNLNLTNDNSSDDKLSVGMKNLQM